VIYGQIPGNNVLGNSTYNANTNYGVSNSTEEGTAIDVGGLPPFKVTKEQWEALVATVKRLSADIDALTKNGQDLTRAFNQASRGERPVGYWEEG
jgi:hypothetical protein